jgi:hypothetical protein
MIDGIYYNPTRIIFGKGSESSVGSIVSQYSNNILLHYGNSSFKKYGLYEKVINSLNQCGVRFRELGGVQSNPKSDLVYEGIEICRKYDIDFILVVGGSSVIDSAKAIAISVLYDGDFWDIYKKQLLVDRCLKIGVVSTFGTGSECSHASIITNTLTNNKISYSNPVMFPQFAVMNPELTMTIDKYMTSCGIVDAIVHVTERYFSNTDYVDCTDRICESLIQTLMKYAVLVQKDPLNYEIRSEIMWASKLAHDNTCGFGRKQDWTLHTIAHEIGGIYNCNHGAILGVLLPFWIKYVANSNSHKVNQLARRIFDNQSPSLIFGNFVRDMNMPSTLRQLGINNKKQFNKIANLAVRFNQSGTIGNYVRLAPYDIVSILNLAY